jgi:PTS system ascorbate-specific IIA component
MMEQIDAGDGVLILTDIFGATPGNVVSKLLQDGKVEGVSGVSLPMLLRVLTGRTEGSNAGSNPVSVSVLVQRAMSGGSEGLVHMNTDRCLDA